MQSEILGQRASSREIFHAPYESGVDKTRDSITDGASSKAKAMTRGRADCCDRRREIADCFTRSRDIIPSEIGRK